MMGLLDQIKIIDNEKEKKKKEILKKMTVSWEEKLAKRKKASRTLTQTQIAQLIPKARADMEEQLNKPDPNNRYIYEDEDYVNVFVLKTEAERTWKDKDKNEYNNNPTSYEAKDSQGHKIKGSIGGYMWYYTYLPLYPEIKVTCFADSLEDLGGFDIVGWYRGEVNKQYKLLGKEYERDYHVSWKKFKQLHGKEPKDYHKAEVSVRLSITIWQFLGEVQ